VRAIARQRGRKLRHLGLRHETSLARPAEVDLDRIEAPGGKAVGVLLVVAERADTGITAAAGPGVGINADFEAEGVEITSQATQAARPLGGIGDQVAASIPCAAAPAPVEPNEVVATLSQTVLLELGS
jgi:hypothetical protein